MSVPTMQCMDEDVVKAIRRYNCVCGNNKCEQLREQVYMLFPDGHEWKKGEFGLHRINAFDNPKYHFNLALQKSAYHHFPLSVDSNAVSIRIALIHWPPLLLKNVKRRSTPFESRQKAKEADSTYFPGGQYFCDNVNKMDYLLAKVVPPNDILEEWKTKFVQAPIFPPSKVESELISFEKRAKMQTPRIAPAVVARANSVANNKLLSTINSLGGLLEESTPTNNNDTYNKSLVFCSTDIVTHRNTEEVGFQECIAKEKSMQDLMDDRVDGWMDNIMDDRTDNRMDSRIDSRMDSQMDSQMDSHANSPIDSQIGDHLDSPTDRSDDRSDDRPDNRSDDRSDDRSVNTSDDRSDDRPDNRSDDRPDYRSVNTSDDRSDNQSDNPIDSRMDCRVDNYVDVGMMSGMDDTDNEFGDIEESCVGSSLSMHTLSTPTMENRHADSQQTQLPFQVYFDSAASVEIHQSIETTEIIIRNCCNSMNFDVSKLQHNKTFVSTLNHLYYSLQGNQVIVSKRNVLLLCDKFGSPNCTKFMFRTYKRNSSSNYLCDNCRKVHRVTAEKISRKQSSIERGTNRTDQSSYVPHTALSPGALGHRCHSMAKEINRLKGKLRYSQLRLDLSAEKKTMVVHEEDTGLATVLKLALTDCSENKETFIETIINTLLLTLSAEHGDVEDDQKQKIRQYAELIASTLKNYLTVLEGKQRQVRFHPKVIRTALAAWLSSPSNYNVLRANSIEMLPSSSYLSKIQQGLVTQEGECARVYQWLREDRNLTKASKLTGIVTFDEMHLTSDLTCNVKNNHTYGFASSNGKRNQFDFATELNSLYKESLVEHIDNNEDNSSEALALKEAAASVEKNAVDPAKKMNLFRVKLNNGHSANLEYWFNAGSLTAEDLVGQLLRVILHLEMIDIEVHMICSDAGGGNTGLFNALRSSRLNVTSSTTSNVWFFWNPYSPKRRVFIVPCSVHGLKAMRNSLLNSTPSGSRNFMFDSIPFGWEQKQKLLEADKPPQRQSSLTPQAINPDGCSKMCVKDALAPFTYKTITFEMNDCVRDLHPNDQKLFNGEVAKRKLQNSNMNGYEAEYLDGLLKLLKQVVSSGKYTDNSYLAMKSKLKSLEYSVAVHGIFVARMLNYKCFIVLKLKEGQEKRNTNKENFFFVELDSEWKRMQYYDGKIMKWWKFVQKCKGKKDAGWIKYCLSVATIKNLRQTMWGFMRYVKTMLEDKRLSIQYVPYHLANQSTIEMQFSMLRGANRNKASDMAKGLLAISMSSMLDAKRLDRGKAYSGEMVQQSEVHIDGAAYTFQRRDKKRDDEWLKWVAKRKCIQATRRNYKGFILGVGSESCANHDQFSFWRQKLYGLQPISEVLFENKKFIDTAKASIFEETSKFFEALFTLPTEEEELLLDSFCCAVNDKVLSLLLTNSSHVESLFYRYIISDEFDSLTTTVAPKLLHRGCLSLLACSLKMMMMENITNMVQSTTRQKIDFVALSGEDKEEFEAETRLYVNRFIGYGLQRLIVLQTEKVRNDDALDELDSPEMMELKFFRSLRVQAVDILFMKNYQEHWYDPVFLLQNKGLLSLLSPDYLEFGYKVMTIIRQQMTVARMRMLGNNSLSTMMEEILMHNDTFYEVFDECYTNRQTNQELTAYVTVRRKAVNIIVDRSCHAYYSSVLKYMREQLTKRGAKHYKANNFRPDLASKNDVKRQKIITEELPIGR